ncbi:hypothetical protein PVAG01_08814 [Phlyctema vagabunda]|uniref:Small secreted protein n=1 Tax=Phlyctema vagabunda TaxID=108571 RepID=A0ABR4PAJ8_9HELO
MRFSIIAASALATLVIAAPTGKRAVQKRAIFPTVTYDEITIAGGQAGDAEAEANAVFTGFGLDLNDLASLDEADLDFLNNVNSAANDAEKGVYNPAVEAATGAEADAIQAAKIKNKVLKLTATMLKLKAEEAQGTDTTAEQAAEQKKLDNNISQDVAAAGTATTAIPFDATIEGGAAGGAATGGAAADDAAADDASAEDAAADDASADDAAADDAAADDAAADDAAADDASADDAAADEEDAAAADDASSCSSSSASTKASKNSRK